jgi:hypothetical protein
MTDISRTSGMHKKRDVSVMVLTMIAADMAAADTYEAAVLPSNVLITASSLVTLIPFDGTTPTVAAGFQGGTGAELIAATAIDSAADTVVAGNGDLSKQTGAVITLTKVGTSTVGHAIMTIEYIEHEQCTGELTNFVPAA